MERFEFDSMDKATAGKLGAALLKWADGE